jgi:hypothetical protein
MAENKVSNGKARPALWDSDEDTCLVICMHGAYASPEGLQQTLALLAKLLPLRDESECITRWEHLEQCSAVTEDTGAKLGKRKWAATKSEAENICSRSKEAGLKT